MATTHAVRKHENATLRLLVTLIHLSFWAQLGVLTRIMLDKFFQLGCAGSWGPCPQSERAAAAAACAAAASSHRPLARPNCAAPASPLLPPLSPTPDGAYFKDLPSNMLGSFVIGLFAASSTVGLAVDKPLAALPAGHTWQHNFELQIGAAREAQGAGRRAGRHTPPPQGRRCRAGTKRQAPEPCWPPPSSPQASAPGTAEA